MCVEQKDLSPLLLGIPDKAAGPRGRASRQGPTSALPMAKSLHPLDLSFST